MKSQIDPILHRCFAGGDSSATPPAEIRYGALRLRAQLRATRDRNGGLSRNIVRRYMQEGLRGEFTVNVPDGRN